MMRKRKTPVPPPRTTVELADVETPTIFVDDRAGSRDLLEHQPLSVCGEATRLDSGDVCFPGNGPNGTTMLVGVEVKTVTDLISSMETGRFQGTQLPAMLEQYHVCWLLVVGRYRTAANGIDLEVATKQGLWAQHRLGTRPVPYGYLTNFMAELNVVGMHTATVATTAEAAAWIGALARWWAKPWSKHTAMRKLDRSRDGMVAPKMDPHLRLLAKTAVAWPGLGFERALAAAKHFGSVEAMVAATEQQWAEVPGVGKILAKAVWEAIRCRA